MLRNIANQVPTRFIPSGTSRTVFQFLRDDGNAVYWDKLDRSRRTEFSI